MEQITVQELFAFKPVHKAVIAAGWPGCANTITDIVEFQDSPCLKSGCLVLIHGNNYDEDTLSLMLDACLEVPIAGILLTGGHVAIDAGRRELADKKQVPIAVLAGEISRELLVSLFGLALQLKKDGSLYSFIEGISLEDYYQHIQKGFPALLSGLRSYLANPVVLVNPSFEIVACGGDSNHPAPFLAHWIRNIYNKDYHRKNRDKRSDEEMPVLRGTFTMQDGETADYYAASLNFGGLAYGTLLLFETRKKVNEMDLLRLRQTSLICLRELVSRKQYQEMEESYQSQFVYDLLYNNFDNAEVLIQRGAFWGWDLSRPHQLLVLDANTGNLPASKENHLVPVLSAVTSVLRMNCQAGIACELMGKIIVIFPDAALEAKDRKNKIVNIASKIQQYLHAKLPEVCLAIGVGRFYPATAEMCRSYQEAKQALELGRFINNGSFITFFEDLGAVRLLSNVSWELLDDYYKEYLNALVEYDDKNGTSLLETLQVYFQQNADLNQTAEKLFMHSNTLRYRLKKIEEVLDTDLQRFDNRLNLYLACKIAKIRNASL